MRRVRLPVLEDVDRDWGECQRCPLGREAFKHVLYEIPKGANCLDILFVGEAPGRAENSIGRPFVGPSGKLLRRTIDAANPEGLLIGFSNLLACRPVDREGRDRQPEAAEVGTCYPRLVSIIETLRPLAIIGLGRIPESYLPTILEDSTWEGFTEWLRHPAYLLRQGGDGRNPETQKQSDAYREYLSGFEEAFETVRRLKEPAPAVLLDYVRDSYEKFPLGKGKVSV
jgi:uracil-DNA glycosylase family 4